MKHSKSDISLQLERTSISQVASIPRRYCDRCHLSTPKGNPRCIHCRHPVAANDILGARMEMRVA